MSNFPCIDCITLPICKSVITTVRKEGHTENRIIGICIYKLTNRCSIMNDYIPVESYGSDKLRLNNVKVDSLDIAHKIEKRFVLFLRFFLSIEPERLKVKVGSRWGK